MWGYSKVPAQQDRRDSYCPLLFEKILRSYQLPVVKPKPPKTLTRHPSSCPSIQSPTETQNENKIVVDLNKKMKLIKARSHDENNKENVQDNGATFYELSCSVERREGEIMGSLEKGEQEREEKEGFLDIQEFMAEESRECEGLECRVQINQKENQYRQPQVSMKQEQIELPQIEIPFKQVSKCQILKQQSVYPLQKQEIIVEKEPKQAQPSPAEHPHHLKTKLSKRILKKKLQNQTLQQVVQDLLKHRRIELDGSNSLPEKATICEALLSLMKDEIIH